MMISTTLSLKSTADVFLCIATAADGLGSLFVSRSFSRSQEFRVIDSRWNFSLAFPTAPVESAAVARSNEDRPCIDGACFKGKG